ncbi:MAG: DUF1415 family protein [Polyangia bacterium]
MSDPRVADALARNDRFLVEIVEGWSLCPYARATRLSGQLGREVLLDSPPPAEVAVVASRYEHHAAQIVLVILPDFSGDARAFERFTDECRKLAPDAFAIAPFHPTTTYHTDTPSRLVGLFRRSPDPTLQLVRFTALDAVRKRAPGGKFFFDGTSESWEAIKDRPERGLSEQIADDNWERTHTRAAELAELLAQLHEK